MGALGKTYRNFYSARNFQTGLTNIVGFVYKPDSTVSQMFQLIEGPFPFLGVYYFDYVTSDSDPEGEYVVLIIAPSDNARDISRMSLYQDGGGSGEVSTPNVLVPALLGAVVNPVVVGLIEPQQELAGGAQCEGDISNV